MVRTTYPAIESIRGGLVVSCQTPPGHPLRRAAAVPALAECAAEGNAAGLRIDGVADVQAVAERVQLPIIGIRKHFRAGARPLITTSYRDCERLVHAGARIVAVEATTESTLSAADFAVLVRQSHERLGIPVMADVSTFDEGLRAWESGADLIGTTLSGYTPYTTADDGPDLALVRRLAEAGIRTVLEGRVNTPEDVAAGFANGAWAVVVGKAITDPLATTERFARATPHGVRDDRAGARLDEH